MSGDSLTKLFKISFFLKSFNNTKTILLLLLTIIISHLKKLICISAKYILWTYIIFNCIRVKATIVLFMLETNLKSVQNSVKEK